MNSDWSILMVGVGLVFLVQQSLTVHLDAACRIENADWQVFVALLEVARSLQIL